MRKHISRKRWIGAGIAVAIALVVTRLTDERVGFAALILLLAAVALA